MLCFVTDSVSPGFSSSHLVELSVSLVTLSLLLKMRSVGDPPGRVVHNWDRHAPGQLLRVFERRYVYDASYIHWHPLIYCDP